MTCSCGRSLYSAWIERDGTCSKGLNLFMAQPLIRGDRFLIRGRCKCGAVHEIDNVEQRLRELQGVLVITVQKQELAVRSVKVRS